MKTELAKNRLKPLYKKAQNHFGPNNNPCLDQIITIKKPNLDQIITSQHIYIYIYICICICVYIYMCCEYINWAKFGFFLKRH